MATRLCIIGAGPCGALIASSVRGVLPNVDVAVFDKGRSAGGRMSTARIRVGSASIPQGQGDHGAQYITQLSNLSKSYIESLVAHGVLRELAASAVQQDRKGLPNFVAPNGVSSIPHHYLTQSGADARFGIKVTGLHVDSGRWVVTTEDGSQESFDSVVSTLPAPQVLQLGGDMPGILADAGLTDALKAVKYSIRYAAVVVFAPSQMEELRALMPFAGRYVQPDEDDMVRYVSFDTNKLAMAGADVSGISPSLVVHSSIGYAPANGNPDKETGCAVLLQRLQKLYPALPEPVAVKSHRWLYSQVTDPCAPVGSAGSHPSGYGIGAVLAHAAPPLVLAGDSFTASHFEGCIASAQAAVGLLRGNV